jgi:hypothetical protein
MGVAVVHLHSAQLAAGADVQLTDQSAATNNQLLQLSSIYSMPMFLGLLPAPV